MAGGRPTDYSEEILKKALVYVETTEDEILENGKVKVNLPTIEGLASFIDINRDTIYEWCKVHKEFSDIIEKLREKHTNSLINNGLAGTYNPTIAKVLLSKQGYSEKTETDITTGGDKITDTISKDEQTKLLTLLNDKTSTGKSN